MRNEESEESNPGVEMVRIRPCGDEMPGRGPFNSSQKGFGSPPKNPGLIQGSQLDILVGGSCQW